MNGEKVIERVTISLPTDLLLTLDEISRNLGHRSRSETLRTAARDYIAENRWSEEEGWRVGVIMLQYNHHQSKVIQQINRLRGEMRHLIRSSLSLAVSKDDTMEIIAVQGEADRIKKLIEEARKIRRVKTIRWSLTPCGRSIP
ncbi:MAG: ribbon-helix-helix protein, CopG family [Thaumarchaeota archaeon]|nr:ribbon-helix-helix protein, CopG family [Nitrososphaerota archaeon]MCL5318751.1 ribbon-helix-helix protein, CopG family [Nitrososphaerota archaeon]